MKKITLLIASLFATISALNAEYVEKAFTESFLEKRNTHNVKKLDAALAEIMNYNTEGKTPAQIERALFRALVIENTLILHNAIDPIFLSEFLVSDIDSFESLIGHLVNQPRANFLVQFYQVFNAMPNKPDLSERLQKRKEICTKAVEMFNNKTLNKNEKSILELAKLELFQIQFLDNYLNPTGGSAQRAAICLEQLKRHSTQQASLLRKLTPFLILTAACGTVYVIHHYGDYIAQLATKTYNNVGNFILAHTPDTIYNFATVASGSSSSVMQGFNAIAKSLWNGVPTTIAARAMLSALSKITIPFDYIDPTINKTDGPIDDTIIEEKPEIKNLTYFSSTPDDLFAINNVFFDLHEAKLLIGWYNWPKEKQQSVVLLQEVMPQFFEDLTPDGIQKDLMYLIDRSQSSENFPLGKKATYIYKNAYKKCKKEHPELLQYFTTFNPKLLPEYTLYESMRIKAPLVSNGIESAHAFFKNCFLRSVGATETFINI
jgi:hypothetical protein